MPKTIITESTMPIALHELDKWSGKLTWVLFAERLAKALGEQKISRYTLLSYPVLVETFNAKKDALKSEALNLNINEPDITLEFAKKQIAILESTVARLEKQNDLLLEQFVRWQHNLIMMPLVDMEMLNSRINMPLTEVKRR